MDVDDGYFSTYLGSVEDLDFALFVGNATLYLGVKVGNDDEMSRVLLGAAPYAAYAEYANHALEATSLGGKSATDFMTTSHPANVITEDDITDWFTAYEWGDHAAAGYLKSITAHTHSAANITSGTLPVARGGTGGGSFTSGAVLVGAGTDPVTTVSRSGIDTRASFPPASHSHATLARGTGLTGSNYDGSAARTWAVSFAGTGSFTSAARSDHTHAFSCDRHSQDVSYAAGGDGSATTNWPDGTTLTGGGYWAQGAYGIWDVAISRPWGNGWNVWARNNSASSQTLTLYVVCCSL